MAMQYMERKMAYQTVVSILYSQLLPLPSLF